MQKTLLTTLTLISSLLPFSALAESLPESPAPERPRISLEAGAGLAVISPFYKARIGYRLPMFEDRLDLLLEYTPNLDDPSLTYDNQILMAGARYYFQTEGWFQPYGVANLGAMYHLATPASGIFPAVSAGFDAPIFQFGIGLDFMPTANFGLNAQICAGIGGYLRPELNLKLIF